MFQNTDSTNMTRLLDNGNTVTAKVTDRNLGTGKYDLNFSPAAYVTPQGFLHILQQVALRFHPLSQLQHTG